MVFDTTSIRPRELKFLELSERNYIIIEVNSPEYNKIVKYT